MYRQTRSVGSNGYGREARQRYIYIYIYISAILDPSEFRLNVEDVVSTRGWDDSSATLTDSPGLQKALGCKAA